MATQIYHNPRCSKSRQTMQLLEENGIEADVILYLQTPPDIPQLKRIVAALALPAKDIVRTGEAAFKALDKSVDEFGEDELYQAIVDNPILLQRPIVVHNQTAAIGRPPESVLALF